MKMRQIFGFLFPQVVWQHKVGEVENDGIFLKLCTSGTFIPKINKSDNICESYAQMKRGPVLFDSPCRSGRVIPAMPRWVSICCRGNEYNRQGACNISCAYCYPDMTNHKIH